MTICSIEECGGKVLARGWCGKHYERWRRYGDPAKLRDKPACSIAGCDADFYARGHCEKHYAKMRKYGDPLAGVSRHASPAAALASNTRRNSETGCIEWTGLLNYKGYGSIYADGTMMGAHRFAWMQENGAIPEGMVIDHTCWNRACVNVAHLRLATPQQNRQSLSGAHPNSATGVRGVVRRGSRYRAYVGHNGTRHYLGTFDTIEEASAAAQAKRVELFGEFAGAA